MEDRISLRQWQKNFLDGKYDSFSRKVQIEAGWFDWFCEDETLLNKTKTLAKILLKIQDDFILDNFYINFKNCCPMNGPLYNRIILRDLNKERDFCLGIDVDSPYVRKNYSSKYNLWFFDEKGNIIDFYRSNQKELIKTITTVVQNLIKRKGE